LINEIDNLSENRINNKQKLDDIKIYTQRMKNIIKEMRKALSSTTESSIALKKQNEALKTNKIKIEKCLIEKRRVRDDIRNKVQRHAERIKLLF
jgi:chromosome segregation ATPase